MGLAAPIGLAALLGLLLPLIIHLRQRRSRRTVLMGSIRHLASAPAPPRSGLRMTEHRLLAVRLLLVSLLAFMLARPFITGISEPAPARHVALVSTLLAGPEPPPAAASLLDSLRTGGAEVRPLPHQSDVWGALRSLDAELPQGSRITLVTTQRVRISGRRPGIGAAVSVHLLPHPADSQAAQPRILPTRRRVTILADPTRQAAARYLSAAFRAVAEVRGDTLDLQRGLASDAGAMAGSADDWVVWLTDTASSAAPAAARRGFSVLTDAGSREGTGVRVGTGDPPLYLRRIDDGLLYTLGGRFDTRSGDLVLSRALPELLASIWPEPASADAVPRWVTAAQLQPAVTTHRRGRAQNMSLAGPLLGLSALLFLLERWLAHRGGSARLT